jgi:hypothetical protein
MNVRTSTRSLIACGIVSLLGVACTSAQTNYSESKASTMLTVGAGLAGGVSMTIDPPVNWKIAPALAYRADVDATYPLNSTIFATLNLGIDSRGEMQSWYNNSEVRNSVTVNYFSITPGFRVSAFQLALNIGFPLGGVRTWKDGGENGEVQRKLDPTIDGLKTMIEPRIGAVIPVFDNELGWLGVTVAAGYNLNDISTSPDVTSGLVEGNEVSTNTITLHVGATFQLAIPGTQM